MTKNVIFLIKSKFSDISGFSIRFGRKNSAKNLVDSEENE